MGAQTVGGSVTQLSGFHPAEWLKNSHELWKSGNLELLGVHDMVEVRGAKHAPKYEPVRKSTAEFPKEQTRIHHRWRIRVFRRAR